MPAPKNPNTAAASAAGVAANIRRKHQRWAAEMRTAGAIVILPGTEWVKASACASATCVEVSGGEDGTVYVRDSKHPDLPPLVFTKAEWDAFTAGVRNGEFLFDG